MNDCSLHLTPVVIDLLSTARVRIVTFAPNTTQIFQVLDLSLFGVLKRPGQYQLPFGDDTESASFIKKVYHDFRSTMTDMNPWGAIRGIGLISNIVDAVQRVSFSKIIMQESHGFRRFWDIAFPVENLSIRGRNAKFEWINRPE
jgi:hypothetical protein